MKFRMNAITLLDATCIISSFTARMEVNGKNMRTFIISVITVLFVISPVSIINEYRTAKIIVYQMIESRNAKCQTPLFADIISHIRVIRYASAINTRITPPTNLPRIIFVLETGFESVSSMFPFCSRDGIKDDERIMKRIITIRKEGCEIISSSILTTKE
jgi:hypothetical protein